MNEKQALNTIKHALNENLLDPRISEAIFIFENLAADLAATRDNMRALVKQNGEVLKKYRALESQKGTADE